MMKFGTSPRDMAQVMQSQNTEGIFVQRLQHAGSQGLYSNEARAPAPPTYWKSPYAGETLRHKTLYIKSGLTHSLNSKHARKEPVDELQINVKGILKSGSSQTQQTQEGHMVQKSEISPRSAFRKLNAISAGTRRQTVMDAVSSTGKKVQFEEKLPPAVTSPNKHGTGQVPINVADKYRGVGQGRSAENRVSVKRNRVPHELYQPTDVRGSNSHSMTIASNVRTPVSVFMKRLSVSESPRTTNLKRAHSFVDTIAQQRTAEKLKRPNAPNISRNRVSDGGKILNTNELPGVDRQIKEAEDVSPMATSVNSENGMVKKKATVVYRVYRSGKTYERRRINSSEDSSSSSYSEENYRDNSPGGAPITRPRTTASLYTRYNGVHFRTNDVNCRHDSLRKSSRQKILGPEGDRVLNFCDNGKTNQIIGWLQQVKTAQSTEGRSCHSSVSASNNIAG